MKNWVKFLLTTIAALLLGISLTFAFAPYEIFPLAILAPLGLLAFLLTATPKRAFLLGWIFGLGFFGVGVYWVFISIHFFGDVSSLLAGFITACLIAFMAIFPGLVCYLTNYYFPSHEATKIICAFPALWVLSEWIRSWIFTGFPWLLLGYSQTNSPLKGYAPLLGVYGVSLATLLTSAFLLNALLQYKQHRYQQAYLNLFACLSLWIFGALTSLIPWTQPNGNPLSISLVQGNIPQSVKWSPEHLQLSFDRYEKLTEPLWGKSKLIIWPEAAIPLPLREAASFIENMDQKAQQSGSQLILGIPIKAQNANGYYNAIITLGKEKKVYTKRHLVPFGEYTPLSNLFANLFKLMNIPMSDIVPGNLSQEPLDLGNIKLLSAICYEIAYPEFFDVNDKTISALLTITNDAWFGESNAEAQHLQMAEMRALELARPVIFVSNDGITALIAANGQLQASLPQREAQVLTSQVQPMLGLTPWMRNGMDPILFILLCLLVAAVRTQLKQAKQASLLTQKQNTFINSNKQT